MESEKAPDLTKIPPKLAWRGPPSREITAVILSLTRTDSQGRRFYRPTPNGAWRRLRDGLDHQALNRAVDGYRVLLSQNKPSAAS